MNYINLFNDTHKKIKSQNVIKELLCHHGKLSREQLLCVMEEKINFKLNNYYSDVDKYISGVPIQHITGITHFRGITIKLNNGDAFIPRYETEQLIDYILAYKQKIFGNKRVDIADIGTGTGAIALSLARELPILNMYCVELNPKSLIVAKNNFNSQNLKIKLFAGDGLNPLMDKRIKVDILVSNPPYIPSQRKLDQRVMAHDPKLALYSGIDGLDMFRKLFKDAKKVLKNHYLICFEHDDSQIEGLKKLINKFFPNSLYEFINDLANKPRFLIIWKNKK